MPSILRGDNTTLIPEDYAEGILKNATEKSAVMQLARTRRMSRKQQRMSVLSSLPTVSWVTGSDTDVGLKATTNVSWANLLLNAEPLAAIVPIAQDLLDDQDYNLWDDIKPLLEQEIAAAIDGAVFFGTGAPATFPTALVTQAVSAGNTVNAGTGVDIAADVNSAMGAVESDGYYPSGFVMRMAEKAVLRGLRDVNRQFLFSPKGPSNVGVSNAAYVGELYGERAYISNVGLTGFSEASTNTRYLTGDFRQLVFGIRSDMTYTVLKEATLYNPDGSVMVALAQQDMVALRVVMRCGWQVTNPVTKANANNATRFPFAVVRIA